jgi:hypothetical protein
VGFRAGYDAPRSDCPASAVHEWTLFKSISLTYQRAEPSDCVVNAVDRVTGPRYNTKRTRWSPPSPGESSTKLAESLARHCVMMTSRFSSCSR